MRLIILFIALVLGFSTLCYADEIEERVRHAHERIERGINSGALTREEAHRLKDELNNVRDDEARMKADGRLNRYEKEKLEKELDRLERHISRLKSNDDRKGYDDRRDNHHQRWIHCAAEDGFCKFHGQKNVRYGVDGNWIYKTAQDGIPCKNRFFGDPAPGAKKSCYIEAD
jgi:hypothetical protein